MYQLQTTSNQWNLVINYELVCLQIKRKMEKTNWERKHSGAKTAINLKHRIIKCNTKKIGLTIYVFCITKCMIIIETKYPQSNKKEKETKNGKQKKRSND